MTELTTINNIPIGRPLLSVIKRDIFNFAHKFEIPYLKDTTDGFCLRGRIRKTVMPLIMEVNESITNNLNYFGQQSNQWQEVINDMIIQPIIDSVQTNQFGFVIPYPRNNQYDKMPNVLWAKILSTIFHNRGNKMMTQKNLIHFLSWLKNKKNLFRTSNFYYCFYESNNLVFSHEHIFVNKKEPLLFSLSEQQNVNINYDNWTIRYQIINQESIQDYKLSRITQEQILSGQFSFYSRICSETCSETSSETSSISYSVNKYSDSKRFIKGPVLCKYIPKICFGPPCQNCRKTKQFRRIYVEYSFTPFNI